MKIRILKDHSGGKVGEIKEASFPAGDQQEYVDGGLIEILGNGVGKLSKSKSPNKKEEMTIGAIKKELQKALELEPLEQDEFLEDLSKKSGRRITRLREQLKIYSKKIEELTDDEIIKEEDNPQDILKEQANEQETENYSNGVNWTDKEYYKNSWKRLKGKTASQLRTSDFLFQLFSSEGRITGKPQIRDNDVKTNITLLIKAVKNNKDGEQVTSYKFIDDPYNRRDDGYEEDVLEKDYWVYDVVDNGIKNIVLCGKKLKNHEVHTFYGTQVRINHSKEFDKNLICRGSANLFFCNKSESTIKPIDKNDLITYVKKFISDDDIPMDEYTALMKDYIFMHENGYIYNQPENYCKLRHSVNLSGKKDGYPLHLLVWGEMGIGKTQELECSDNIFQETILEAANSTPKALIPSFSEKIPNPGFILSCNRVAHIDELMKMVDNALNNTRGSNDVKNQFSNLNFILEHRKRRTNSGNGQLYCIPTAQVFACMNPSQKSKYIHEELQVLDGSTISRTIPYVKGKNYVDFIEKNELKKCAKTHPLCWKKEEENKKNITHDLPLFAQRLRAFYVTIFDSCKVFNAKIDEGRVKKVHESLVNLAKNPMKTLWKRRGYHHTFLVLDGIVKYRCLFEDLDKSFEAKDIDYDTLEKTLVEMVINWDYNMGIKEDPL